MDYVNQRSKNAPNVFWRETLRVHAPRALLAKDLPRVVHPRKHSDGKKKALGGPETDAQANHLSFRSHTDPTKKNAFHCAVPCRGKKQRSPCHQKFVSNTTTTTLRKKKKEGLYSGVSAELPHKALPQHEPRRTKRRPHALLMQSPPSAQFAPRSRAHRPPRAS